MVGRVVGIGRNGPTIGAVGAERVEPAAGGGDDGPVHGDLDRESGAAEAAVTLTVLVRKIEIQARKRGNRVETFTLVNTTNGAVSPASSFSQVPNAVRPLNLPSLKITSVGGATAPTVPPGGTADVALPPTATNPMAIVVGAKRFRDWRQFIEQR
jgi:hypothetical protein